MTKPKQPKPKPARVASSGLSEIARRFQPAPTKPVIKPEPKGKS